MGAIRVENLTKAFGHLVDVDHVAFEEVLNSSRGWKPIEERWYLFLAKPRGEDNCHTLGLVAFGLPCRLHVAPVIGSGDIEYQAYPGVHHS